MASSARALSESRPIKRLDRAASADVASGWARDEPLERPSSARPCAILFPSPRHPMTEKHLDGLRHVAFVVEMLADQLAISRALLEAFSAQYESKRANSGTSSTTEIPDR